MAVINIGGPMPDGTSARDFFVEESEFYCASGTAMQGGMFKQILGKLCLTRSTLIMLPYEGVVLKVAEFLAGKLRSAMLGEFSDMADALERLGLIHNGYEILNEVLIIPLVLLDADAWTEDKGILFIRGGADLVVPVAGDECRFNLKARGYEVAGFASAEDFCETINQLR